MRRLSAPVAAVLALAGCQSRTAQEQTSLSAEEGGGPPPEVATYVRVAPADAREMATFGSDRQLKAYIADAMRRLHRGRAGAVGFSGGEVGELAAAEPAAPPADANQATTASKSADSDDRESITNTQEAGVDEGGIVKAHGDFLIVLRRGRLFSVRLRAGEVTPVSMVDVTPPGRHHDAWYDEMLVSDDRIVVVGYSYEVGATELGLFDIDGAGRIRYRATHYLRSNDYYSSRNYASRLVGDKLVFYMPYALAGYDGAVSLPGVKKQGARKGDWTTIIGATSIYRPIQEADWPVLHTVVTCDLGGGELACTASGIIGPYARTFYVSEQAVYVWVQGDRGAQTRGVVYRLPLDGDGPGALRVEGAPVDQFSFKEDDGGHLNVLVRAEGNGGDWMWSPELSTGDVALLRVPVAAFTSRVGTARAAAYRELPRPDKGYSMQNRFVGAYVLYGTGSSWGYAEPERDDRVFVAPYAGGTPFALRLVHGVDRIEAMGDGAVVIGTDGKSLHFTSVDLERQAIADRYTQKHAAQGELRSHGFFYKPMADGKGVLGLPVRAGSSPGYEHLVNGSAQVLFLDVDHLQFARLGALESGRGDQDDQCVVSCVDWYGN
ncbi:MAG TPA: beta-propeller domain-containing protein, partial [Kofleriaceae bacterium]|nr:beta-propeller domain-containing protein [Kofleriaceae bacterium]